MPLVRIFAVLLVCSLPSVAQDQAKTNLPPANSKNELPATANGTPSEPWKIVLAEPHTADTADDVLARLQNGQSHFTVGGSGRALLAAAQRNLLLEDIPLQGDDICYTIRSYVVARDSKDSDSTHPVKSSTCQPGSHYRLKTAVETRTDENR
jgi:hypothetical protein